MKSPFGDSMEDPAAMNRDVATAIANLVAQRDAIDAQIRELRSVRAEPAPAITADGLSVTEKVRLFRSLFRGREDVFPTRWENSRTDRSGYSPACRNEWARGLCEKPRVKCGACPHQAFIPVTDRIIHDHLAGRLVAGIYPLLPNDTCWFVAADFDRKSWRDDVVAFRVTCQSAGVPVAIERSRSGDGAHAWFFFSQPVQASVARAMACHLLTETIARRRDLGLRSYDRLFPNQDRMPAGGFGNLIALPLQFNARSAGNTVFLDDDLEPFPDQWAFLRSVKRLPAAVAVDLAAAARRSQRVVAVRDIIRRGQRDAPDATSSRSGQEKGMIPVAVPDRIEATLSGRLRVPTAELPIQIVSELKRIATLSNPEFHARARMRLSTARTPRVISCFDEEDDAVLLPRGCLEATDTLLRDHGGRLMIDDRRTSGDPLQLDFHGTLTPMQAGAVDALVHHEIGTFVAPPGSGKTVVAAALIAARNTTTVVLVHRKQLLEQWIARLSAFLDIDARAIGQIGGGKSRITGTLDVAMIQSLARDREAPKKLASYGHIVVDECHHVPAYTFERLVREAPAKHVTGLTATPTRRDGLHPIMEMQVGPVRASMTRADSPRFFRQRLIIRETDFESSEGDPAPSIQRVLHEIIQDERRNETLVDDIIAALEEGRTPLVLTERRDHLEILAKAIRRTSPGCIVLHGGLSPRNRKKALRLSQEADDGRERVVLAIGKYIGEGFDDCRLDTLFLAMPISWRGTLAQYVGRLHRRGDAKEEVRVHDYVDAKVPSLSRMASRRHASMRALGYDAEDAPPPIKSSTVVEMLEEAIAAEY
jgi:superfamily II DNA or RNA helicase